MTRSKRKKWESLNTIGVIGNYQPRRCGIATFTTDLTESIAGVAPWVNIWAVVMNDTPEGYRYPARVRFEINENQPPEYHLAADFLNMNQIDVVCVQHEYGIFGGVAGDYILELLRELRMPVVTTLHTVLKDPDAQQREVMRELVELSDRVVVMSERASEFLRQSNGVPPQKIAMIPHGIPDIPFADPDRYKDQFGVAGHKVILSFGLLSPGKGVENTIDALPAIVGKHPDAVYVIVGATHPHVRKASGEEYRLSLQLRAKELGVAGNVVFHNRFVEVAELCEFLGAADVYVTAYPNEAQIVSGTLAYALGAGKAVVSTPYWYAQEMLADGRGVLVPFRDPDALAREVIALLDDGARRQAVRKKAYDYTRRMVWKEVAGKYVDLFMVAKRERLRRPKVVYRAKTVGKVGPELPEVKLDHLRRLTDDTGILQHAKFTVPDRTTGYCTDDNARALIVAMMAQQLLPEDPSLDLLASRYLSFLDYAFCNKTGRFRNFMTYDRKWRETAGSEDSHGRALWGLGMALALSRQEGQVALTLNLFQRALPAVENFASPRSWAFTIVGIHAYLRRFSGDSYVRRIRAQLAEKLFEMFQKNRSKSWPWLEDSLNYCNARIPHALMLSGQWMGRGDMIETGLEALEWLVSLQTAPQGHFIPIGNHGWYSRGGRRARFDQQPVEAPSTIDACVEAFNVTRKEQWLETARTCLDWFLGRNDLRLSIYDHATGGCRDGLGSEGVNQNEGAESTVSWLVSLLTLRARLSAGRSVESTLTEVAAGESGESTQTPPKGD